MMITFLIKLPEIFCPDQTKTKHFILLFDGTQCDKIVFVTINELR